MTLLDPRHPLTTAKGVAPMQILLLASPVTIRTVRPGIGHGDSGT